MSKPMSQVACPKCHLLQAFRGQHNCIHCSQPLKDEDMIPEDELEAMFNASIPAQKVEKMARQKIP